MDKSKYKRLASLYVTGTELEFSDGTVMWMQVPNSFEYDEAKNAAQTAKARMVLSLREVGSDELAKMEAAIEEEGREQIIDVLAASHQGEWMLKATQEVMDDPEWSERMTVLERADDPDLPAATQEEKDLVARVSREYFIELNERIEREEAAEKRRLEAFSDDDLREEYLDLWIERRGGEAAAVTYRVNECFYAARACDGVKHEDDDGNVTWDHSACDTHRERAYESVSDLRELPDDLQQVLVETMESLNMEVTQAKDLGSATSSSDSSPTPNDQEGSEPSAPAEASSTPPGT